MIYDVLWNEMESTPVRLEAGKLRRRICLDSQFNLFLGLEQPSKQRLMLLIVAIYNIETSELLTTKAIVTDFRRDKSTGGMELELRLVDRKYAEVFSVLVDDLINVVVMASNEKEAVNVFLVRLKQWQRFLERAGPDGLSEEAQCGLYAELWFLRHYLLTIRPYVQAISAWVGPYATPQDFRLADWAVEVKATIVKSPQYLSIANEWQLDDKGFEALFLLHLSLEAYTRDGETLPAMVDLIRHACNSDAEAVTLLEERLIAGGYLNIHREHYEGNRYTVRKVTFFQVRETFPRLVKEDLPVGISHIQYAVALPACMPFKAEPSTIRTTLLRD